MTQLPCRFPYLTVVSGGVDVESVVRLLGGGVAAITQAAPVDDDPVDLSTNSRWYLDCPADGTVALLQVNNFQTSRPVVLRRLSGPASRVHSAFWNIEMDNAFNYAVAGDLITAFNGEDPTQRWGADPDALEAVREPLWAIDGSWQAAMLSLIEVRTGVRLVR